VPDALFRRLFMAGRNSIQGEIGIICTIHVRFQQYGMEKRNPEIELFLIAEIKMYIKPARSLFSKG
jgi:hypothetical protein